MTHIAEVDVRTVQIPGDISPLALLGLFAAIIVAFVALATLINVFAKLAENFSAKAAAAQPRRRGPAMSCGRCGEVGERAAKFCRRCGAELSQGREA